jgi:hypothetical protein
MVVAAAAFVTAWGAAVGHGKARVDDDGAAEEAKVAVWGTAPPGTNDAGKAAGAAKVAAAAAAGRATDGAITNGREVAAWTWGRPGMARTWGMDGTAGEKRAADEGLTTGKAAADIAIETGVERREAWEASAELSARAVAKLSAEAELSAIEDEGELEERLGGGDRSSNDSTGPGRGGSRESAAVDGTGGAEGAETKAWDEADGPEKAAVEAASGAGPEFWGAEAGGHARASVPDVKSWAEGAERRAKKLAASATAE